MAVPKIRSITPTKNGEVTLSPSASKQLGADKGTKLIEVSTDNCVILLPENDPLSEAMNGAKEALSRAGVTVEEVKAEVERLKEERMIEIARHPFFDYDINVDQLATDQSVPSKQPFENFFGNFCPENEDLDSFLAEVKELRHSA